MQHRRFATLDELRGLAALLVVLHHAGPLIVQRQFLPRAYLAVDFFFMLSGFVLARTLERGRQQRISVARFLQRRLRRLYPIMVLGILSGAVLASFQEMDGTELLIRLAAQLLFIPILVGAAGTYALNGVQWSLAFELVANAVHAGGLWRLHGPLLALVVFVAALALAGTAFHFGSAGVGDRSIGFWGGFPRVAFSYSLGLLIHDLHRRGLLRVPALSRTYARVLLVFVLIGAGIVDPARSLWWIDPVVITTLLPLVLLIGIFAIDAPGRTAAFAGRISYPLYAVHLPVIGFTVLCCGPGYATLGLALLLSVVAAALVSLWLDQATPTSEASDVSEQPRWTTAQG